MSRQLRLIMLGVFLVAHAGDMQAQDSIRVIDDFESIAAWEARPSDGVTVRLSRDRGVKGGALRVDFDFHGGGGYAVIRRDVDFTLATNYEFRWSMRAVAPRNNLEFKLADASGDNVWWSNQRDYDFPRAWTTIVRKKRHISFAWGPSGGGELARPRAIELAITAGSGGKGTIWLDEMIVATLPPTTTTPPVPVARASMGLEGSGAANVLDGDSTTFWRGAPGASLTIDLQQLREFGGVAIAWDGSRIARSAVVSSSRDGTSWTKVRTIADNRRSWTPVRLPEHEARYVRIVLPQGGGIAEVSVEPLNWIPLENDLLRLVAARRPRGTYPRVWANEATYWTVIGLDRDSSEALISADGAIEVGKGAFSIEPFVTLGDGRMDWSNVTATASLAHGALPMPRVDWASSDVVLSIEAFVSNIRGASCLVATYRVTNNAARAQQVGLRLALRPMQVNAPWQFLQVDGGYAPIRSVRMTRTEGAINGTHFVFPVGAADRVTAGTFDAGDGPDLRDGIGPMAVIDEQGLASAGFSWSSRLVSGGSHEFAATVPMHAAPRADRRCRLTTLREVAAHREQTAAWWQRSLSTFEVSLPGGPSPLTETLRASLAWILINRDGASVQPGSRSYERSWIRDGALTSTALLKLGHAEEVRDFIEWYAPFQFANGKIPCCVDRTGAGPVPENDSHGQFIYLVAEFFRHTGDTALVRRVWPRVERALMYQDSLRLTRRTSLYQHPDSAHLFGLLPPSISHEGYSAKPAYSYWDDFFALRGYKDAATLASMLRDPDAARYAAMRDEFARDLGTSIRRAMQHHRISFIPGAADLGDFDPTSTTVALSPVDAEAILPEGAADSSFARYWRESVARANGQRAWENYTPYELRSVGSLVRLGKAREAHDLLQFFFGHQRPPGFRHWAEVVWRDPATPKFIGDMPHTWVASDFVRSALDFFGYERSSDSSFVLGAGVLPEWLSGEGLRVRGIGTHYGKLSLSMEQRDEQVTVQVEGLRVPPGGIHLRPPVGRRFLSASGDGTLGTDGSVRLTRVPATVRAVVAPAEGQR